eukprot:m.192817 g.192817  ORF g.192817 m.192817 type:complete len:497 (+) comp14866_c0_seq5:80-1570(+)
MCVVSMTLHFDLFLFALISLNVCTQQRQDVLCAKTPAGTLVHDTWQWWDAFRTFVPPSNRLAVALVLTPELGEIDLMQRWLGEVVGVVIIPTTTFVVVNGSPTLSHEHADFLTMLLKICQCQVIIRGSPAPNCDISHYHLYTHQLVNSFPPPTVYEQATKGYNDLLEIPLQPLMDHLEASTYETFEKDPVKYSLYEEAIAKALYRRFDTEEERETETVVVMVVGAGRGPLVRRCLSAAKRTNTKVRVYAVEKNPGAVATLKGAKEREWGDDTVVIVSADMRVWQAPEQCDVLVSELLGSWGDNELSPECLDGAQRFLKPNGISIPQSYTSFMAPVAAPRVHTELVGMNKPDLLETPFVVLLHNHFIAAEPQKLFTFTHPNLDSRGEQPADNTRFTKLAFVAACTTTLHGFSGYFESTLFDDVQMSILPSTHSPDMTSWFPMFIPLKTPVRVTEGQVIQVSVWRKAAAQKVWYEWALTSPVSTPVHNLYGHASSIGL